MTYLLLAKSFLFKHIEVIAILLVAISIFSAGWYTGGVFRDAKELDKMAAQLVLAEKQKQELDKQLKEENKIVKQHERVIAVQREEFEKLQLELQGIYAKNHVTDCSAPTGVLHTLRRGIAKANATITSEFN